MHTTSNRLLWMLLVALLPARIASAQIGPTGNTQYVHDVGLTIATTQGPEVMCRSSAAAPTAVSADDEAVLQWCLRNGARATVLTAGGALIGGDATFGLDVDVIRMPVVAVSQSGTWDEVGINDSGNSITTDSPGDTELAAAINSNKVDVNVITINNVTPPPSACDDPEKVTLININLGAGTGNTEIVALNGSTRIYLCGLNFIHDGAGTLQLINGTGTACATGETDMATWTFSATTGYGLVMSASPGGYGRTDAGDALCVERSASVTLTGVASVVQQ